MLDTFRNANQKWYVKLAFGILTLGFVSWGGSFATNQLSVTPAIKVGDKIITADEVSDRFRKDVERMGQMFGSKMTVQDAYKFGLLNRTIDQMVNAALLEQAAERARLGVDEDTLRRTIAAFPAFQGPLKIFDRSTYQRALANANLTEKRFLTLERNDLARGQLIKMITAGIYAPEPLAAGLFRYQAEKRVADLVKFEADKMPLPAAPDAAVLQKYYDEHKAQFQQPEMRAITLLAIHSADLAATIHPAPEDIEKAYQARLGEFQTLEKRAIEQVLFPDAEAAQKFAAAVKSGKDFAATAKEAGQTVADLGTVTKAEMPLAELSEAAFQDAKPGITAPVQSALGWHVMRISAITAGKTRALAEVKDEIVKGLVKEETTTRLYNLSTKLEDSIGGGNDVEETAKTMGMSAIKIAALDEHGRDADGKVVPAIAANPSVIATAFQTVQGGTSDVVALPNNDGYFVLHVDKVSPTLIKPFDSVKDQVVALWQTAQRAVLAKQAAEAALERLRKGESLAAVAGGGKIETTRPFQRTGGQQVPPALAAEMFKADKTGAAAVIALGPDSLLVQLKEIQPADPDGPAFIAARAELADHMTEDLMEEYGAFLRKDIGATVNMGLITQQFTK